MERSSIPVCWTPQGKKGRCKLQRACFDPKFYTSLDTFMSHSCDLGRVDTGICCPKNATYNTQAKPLSPARNSLNCSNNLLKFNEINHSESREWDSILASLRADDQRLALTKRRTTTQKPKVLNADGTRFVLITFKFIHDFFF